MKVYILHGWAYSTEKWDAFVKEFKLKESTPVVLKIPGLTEGISKPWNMDNYINWLDRKLEKEKDKVVLLGHSNGGRIAMAYSIKYPKKIEKLILIDSAGIYRTDLYIKYKRKIYETIAKIGRKLTKIRIAKDILYALIGEVDYKDASENMKKTMINMIDFDKNLDPSKISVSTTIIWGEHDGITPLSDGKTLEKLIVNSKLFVVGQAKHSPQFTHPEKVAEIISKNI